MDWPLGRFRKPEARRVPLVCYLRENGPIAYALDLFGGTSRERVEAMLESGLAWYWTSSLAGVSGRDWTCLTRWSLAALLSDLEVSRQSGLVMLGVDGDLAQASLTDARVVTWLTAFASAAGGPLHVVIRRQGPDADLAFIAQQPPESVRELLHAWGIDRDKAQRRAYARLQDASLEHLMTRLAARE